MKKTFRITLALTVVSILFLKGNPAIAQALPADTINFVVESVAQNLIHNYPFPKISAAYAKMLRVHKKNYIGMSSDELAKKMTIDLRKVNKDVHLSVIRNKAATTTLRSISEVDQLQKDGYGFSAVELDHNTSTAYIAIPYGFNCTQEGFEMAGHAMNMAAYSKYVIIDLRDNRGGAGGMGHFLASYFFAPGEERFYLDGFEKIKKNFQEYTYGYVPGKRLVNSKLYILMNNKTASASEGFAFAMQKFGKATLVGDTSAGAGIAGGFVPVGGDLAMFIPLKMIVAPGSNQGWEGTGVFPDFPVSSETAKDKAKSLILLEIARQNKQSGMRQ